MNSINGLWNDKIWIGNVSTYLDRFKWTDRNTANFRCPLCGDSEKDNRKARGYFYVFEDRVNFKCFNCGLSTSLGNFLKQAFPQVYSEYKLSRFKDKGGRRCTVLQTLETNDPPKEEPLRNPWDFIGPPLSRYPEDHKAVQYWKARGLATKHLQSLYYTEGFRDLILRLTNENHRYKRLPQEPRSLIPLLDEKGNLFRVQGRGFSDGTAKYITIKFKESMPKVFGLNRTDKTLPIIAQEGAVDALLLPNSIAILGGDVATVNNYLKGRDIIWALDNEPRARDTIARTKKAIETGHKVVIWPSQVSGLKDVNTMIEAGYSVRDVLEIIWNNSYTGLNAEVEFRRWKRVKLRA